MLSLEGMMIVAYLGDGEVYCRKCGEAAGLPMSAAMSRYEAESSFFSEGVNCDRCSDEIVEYYPEESE